jgi:hypothetical protein
MLSNAFLQLRNVLNKKLLPPVLPSAPTARFPSSGVDQELDSGNSLLAATLASSPPPTTPLRLEPIELLLVSTTAALPIVLSLQAVVDSGEPNHI